MLVALISILQLLINLVTVVVICQFVLSLLLSFNVLSLSNNFVSALWQSLNAILDPVLRPIRKILPDTGMIDLSPLVLIIGLRILQILVIGAANSIATGTL